MKKWTAKWRMNSTASAVMVNAKSRTKIIPFSFMGRNRFRGWLVLSKSFLNQIYHRVLLLMWFEYSKLMQYGYCALIQRLIFGFIALLDIFSFKMYPLKPGGNLWWNCWMLTLWTSSEIRNTLLEFQCICWFKLTWMMRYARQAWICQWLPE